VEGVESYTLQVDGIINDPAKTASQVWTTLIKPLLDKRGTEIQLTTTEGDLDGIYVLASFEPSRDRKLPRWTYTMRLVKGSEHIIL
jgi:hypothetical protein